MTIAQDASSARNLPRSATSERLIAAALEMFSQRGLSATTREIADAAGVNEVTLFRLFESKDRLLRAVVAEVVREESEALDRVDFIDYDMRRDIANVAEVYLDTHQKYQRFMRTMLANRIQPSLTAEIVREVIQPLRAKFLRYLEEGRRRGVVRRDLELEAAVDAFTGMIFAAVLRWSVYSPEYSREAYLRTCVELFLQGVCA
ncbi:MAG: TetR/AcrR family transcriptional regulator [Acidobacteriota bacterium]|nr:TetR/AcrR family transcriptional regulator [Acidobacteriota bacterium]